MSLLRNFTSKETDGTLTFTVTIPSSQSGSTIVICFASCTNSFWNFILPTFTDDQGNTYTLQQASIGYSLIYTCEGATAGVTSITVSDAFIVCDVYVFELAPCTEDASDETDYQSGTNDFPTAAGPTLTGLGTENFYINCVGGIARASDPNTQTVSSVNSSWTLAEAFAAVGGGDHTSGTAAAYFDGTGAQTPTFTFSANVSKAAIAGIVFEGTGIACDLVVNPLALSFTAEVGGPNPPAQTLAITNGGGSDPVVWTATASEAWISVPTSGTTPDTADVIAVISGLVAGSYSGTISFASSCGPDVIVDLTLTITEVPPPPAPCEDPTGCPFTLGDAMTALGLRLYDPTHQFWSVPELTDYVVEAIRTWNALASFWRDDFLFDTVANTMWYDLTNTNQGTGVGLAPNTLRPLTVTDQYLTEVIEYHLLEPVTDFSTLPLAWTGSAQFSLPDIQQALQRRRDEVLGKSGCFINRLMLAATPGRIALPNRALELRRVAWFPVAGQGFVNTPLFQDDAWALQAFARTYTVSNFQAPSSYRVSTQPVIAAPTGPAITFDVNVQPGVPGQYEVLVIESGLSLCDTASTSGIPDDWTWVWKFGALSDLLSRESNAKDTLREKYAEGRYKHGLALLADSPALLLTLRGNNIPIQIDAVKEADQYRTTWQAQGTGTPNTTVTAGLNLMGLSPIPDAVYSMTATVVRNAPVPVLLTDCIMVTRDIYDVIIDYAQHLASFKMGGAEFEATAPLLDRFMHAAAIFNSKLQEWGQYKQMIWQRSQIEVAMNPRFSDDGVLGG